MSSDDSQNYSARDYDDQYDDEVISESGGSSPGHSDDVEVVDAQPVGGRPAKARPTAPLQSTSSKAPPKKKVQKGEGSSSKPKRKSISKPKTTGGNDVELGADDTPIEITAREEEQVPMLPPTRLSRPGSAPWRWRRPARLQMFMLPTPRGPGLTDALARGAFSLPEMFNMLFKMSPPPEDLVNEKTDYVAGQVAHHISQAASGAAELFVPATVDVTNRDQEIRELKEKVRHLEAHIESLNRYPGSDQFFQDAATLYPSRPADLPALVKSFCSSEDAVAPLLQTLHQDPVGLQALRRVTAWGFHRGKYAMQESVHQALADGIEDWESIRELLPEQIPPPGPEPFSDPPIGSTDPHIADSRSHVP
nr:uncharacterized protein LOC109149872 [Ipomoea batatas]